MDSKKARHPSVELLWRNFLKANPENRIKETPTSIYFCDNQEDADECAVLVVKGIKQATATSLWWFQKTGEALPQVGNQYIVTDWEGNAKAVIETIRTAPTPYKEISAEFAAVEGEGDGSLEYWKKVHQAYFTREMAAFEEKFDENMIIVCEYFKTLFTWKDNEAGAHLDMLYNAGCELGGSRATSASTSDEDEIADGGNGNNGNNDNGNNGKNVGIKWKSHR